MIRTIDLNSDVGESSVDVAAGVGLNVAAGFSLCLEDSLIPLITSANIACGGHAGDDESMVRVIKLCARYGVGIGAHPSYPDRENFGRKDMDMTSEQIAEAVYRQVDRLIALAAGLGLEVRHIKAHGALYNKAAKDEITALAIARGVARIGKKLALFGLANSLALDVWRKEGFIAIGEAFADRRYEPDGSMRSRRFQDALITDPALAAEQALGIARDGKVISVTGTAVLLDARTICIHGDTPGAPAIAERIRRVLGENGFAIAPFLMADQDLLERLKTGHLQAKKGRRRFVE